MVAGMLVSPAGGLCALRKRGGSAVNVESRIAVSRLTLTAPVPTIGVQGRFAGAVVNPRAAIRHA